MNAPHKHFHRLAWIAVALALCVIVFGAFVRLSNAGLSCPDWPTCYGHATWPTQDQHIAAANDAFARPVEVHKTWREQFHRHIAAMLGMLVLGLAVLAARARRHGIATILGASAVVAASIALYIAKQYTASAVLAGLGEAILVVSALRWSNADFARVATLTLAMIIFQAMLGMWTVTWLLKPVVVMGHLLGGMTTLALLAWMATKAVPRAAALVERDYLRGLKPMLVTGIVLVAIQIALGGWVSANYAALACGAEFPKCSGLWWPGTDFGEGFVLWRGIGVDYEGGVLDAPARAAIHMTHRLFAILVAGHLFALGMKLRKHDELDFTGNILWLLLGVQLMLGIANVVSGLPLKIAVAHNAGAAAILLTLVILLARLRPADTLAR